MARACRAITSWLMYSPFPDAVARNFPFVGGDPHSRADRQLDYPLDEAHRRRDQVVLVVDARHLPRLSLRRGRNREYAGQHRGRRRRRQLEVGEIADAGLDRAVDVADEASGARHRGDLHGAVEAAGLGGVDRYDLRRALLDDFDHVMRVPRAFIRHHRRVDRARDLGQARDAFDRLLEIDEIAALHAPIGADRLAWRAVALVGIDAQRDAGADSIADAPHHIDIAVGIDADLDLDG